jgi:hypothetical protein
MVVGGMSRRAILSVVARGGFTAVLSECSAPARGPAVPMDLATKATVLGMPNERFLPFHGTGPLEAEFSVAVD